MGAVNEKSKKNGWFLKFLLGTAAVVALPSAASAQTIDTTGNPFPNSIHPFGEPDTATYGQTFVAPNTSLDGFTFYLQYFSGSTDQRFNAYVSAWNGSALTGPLLYDSGPLSIVLDGTFQAVQINTGGVTLTAGQTYAAFFSASTNFDGVDDLSSWRLYQSNVYADGAYIYDNNSTSFSSLYSTWDNPGNQGMDLAFIMEFSGAGFCSTLTTSADTCTIDSGTTIAGPYDALAGSDTLQLDSSAGDLSFDVGSIGSTFTNFETLEKINAGTVTLTGTPIAVIDVHVADGTLIASGGNSISDTGAVTIDAGAFINLDANEPLARSRARARCRRTASRLRQVEPAQAQTSAAHSPAMAGSQKLARERSRCREILLVSLELSPPTQAGPSM